MKDGFIKVAAGTINTVVADVISNTEEIKKRIAEADDIGVNLLVLPELAVTGFTCDDLFYSSTLLNGAKNALGEIASFTEGKYPLVIVGAPLIYKQKLYNCAVIMCDGELLAVIPKGYSDANGARHFASGDEVAYDEIYLCGNNVPFGSQIVLQHESLDNYTVGTMIGEAKGAYSIDELLVNNGANIIANPCASSEGAGKPAYRRMTMKASSSKLMCGYVCSNAGMGESTQDLVFSQHNLIAEFGEILAENKPFEQNELTASEIDVDLLAGERRKDQCFSSMSSDSFNTVLFSQEMKETKLTRKIEANPFIPDNRDIENERALEILNIQSYGLKKRLEHAHAKTAVIGISGGLDSCLALLVTVRAFDLMKRPRSEIIAVTMPCFGTTSRTKNNAEELCRLLGVTLKTVNIAKSVTQHFEDIGHDKTKLDITFENAQARERTQVIMDIANMENGLVIGTGDLSELALGWATYNGDHMSMYGVNASIPKTLVRSVVRFEADVCGGELKNILYDILDTPVSPELLPADESGSIIQKTEDLVGPYELHDFFLYHMLRYSFPPSKIYRMAKYALGKEYGDEVIKKWLTTFVRRFFIQQFKRSCLPDGPQAGDVSLSPRGGWKMPSDAVSRVWLNDLENL